VRFQRSGSASAWGFASASGSGGVVELGRALPCTRAAYVRVFAASPLLINGVDQPGVALGGIASER